MSERSGKDNAKANALNKTEKTIRRNHVYRHYILISFHAHLSIGLKPIETTVFTICRTLTA